MTSPFNVEADFGSVGGDAVTNQSQFAITTAGGTEGNSEIGSTSTVETTLTLDFNPAECTADTSDPGRPTGPKGRTISLSAFPNPGFVFERWEISTSTPTVDVTFGVFSEFGSGGYTVLYTSPTTGQTITLNKPAGAPTFITTTLNSPFTVIATPANGYQFDKMESYGPDGVNNTAIILNNEWTPYADGVLRSEIRIYFKSTSGAPENPQEESQTPIGDASNPEEFTGGDGGGSQDGREIFE